MPRRNHAANRGWLCRCDLGEEFRATHLRTAPNVMPRRRCFRSNTVKTRIGIRNSVVAAATAGQSWPPSPMMIGMKGGAVCASPE